MAKKDSFQRERLHRAARVGDVNEVERVLDQGLNPNLFDEIGMTPLHYAAAGEHFDVVSLLLRRGARVNAHHEPTISNTALSDVADRCSFRMARLLIDAGADPTIQGWMQLTALDRAKGRGDEEGRKVYALLKAAAKSRHR
jgi:ankyrin repeat protein